MDFIDLTTELESFRGHLEDNPRVIFSAKFGDGKTTFLKEYQEQHNDDCFFITLRPINYSVLKNEDVFEYVKHDILVQLAKKDLLPDFDKDGLWRLAQENIFSLKGIDRILDFLIPFLPNSGVIKKVKDNIVKLLEEKDAGGLVDKIKDGQNTFGKYHSSFVEMRGGLYENDAYTILISATLKEITTRKVLIIEDLDRLDPAHLFRILNVLGAHLDDNLEVANKFGFDNIVVVLDYDVTRDIFHHFYGGNSSYDGYMSKFMSHYPFVFSITALAQRQLWDYIETQCGLNRDVVARTYLPSCKRNLKQMLEEKSVRDLAHALDNIGCQCREGIIMVNEYAQIKINADEKIVRLLSLLFRLNIPITKLDIIGMINESDIDGLNLLGNYMLVEPQLSIGGCFHYNSHLVGAVVKRQDDGTCKCYFVEGQGGYTVEADIDKIVKKALDFAGKSVRELESLPSWQN